METTPAQTERDGYSVFVSAPEPSKKAAKSAASLAAIKFLLANTVVLEVDSASLKVETEGEAIATTG